MFPLLNRENACLIKEMPSVLTKREQIANLEKYFKL